jgi:hypothetical protein
MGKGKTLVRSIHMTFGKQPKIPLARDTFAAVALQ